MDTELPNRFLLYRDEDVHDFSGTGVVAYVVEFPDGTAVMRWCVDGKPKTTTVYDSLADVIEIHGHDGRTWLSGCDTNDHWGTFEQYWGDLSKPQSRTLSARIRQDAA